MLHAKYLSIKETKQNSSETSTESQSQRNLLLLLLVSGVGEAGVVEF